MRLIGNGGCRLRVVIALLLGVLLIVAAGCSGKSDSQSASSGSGAKVVKIGVIAPLTGPASRVGEEFKGAITMAFDEINNQVGDYKIEFKWIDSESDAEKAARAYEQAIVKDKITIGFMDWHAWVSASCMDVAAKYKMPHFFSFGASDVVNQKYKSDPDKYYYWLGKAWPTPSLLSTGYVQTINESIQKGLWTPKNKRVAIYGVDNEWGRTFGTSIAQQFKDAGWEVVTTEWIGLGETEFYPLLSKLKGMEVSLVAGTMSDPPSVSSFIKQSKEVGLKSFIVSDGLGWVGEWYKLTGDASDYVLDQIPQYTTPEAKKFRDDFKARYGFEPGASSAGMCYDWAKFLIKVLQTCLAENGSITTENMAKMGKEKVITGKLTYTNGIIHKEYQYTPASFPDPVVDQQHYMFPVVQYFGGKGKVVWPDAWKEADLQVPPHLKN